MSQETLDMPDQYALEIRFGDEMMEAGFTATPNLFLTHYVHLGISDPQAMWIVHLLRYKWTADAPWPKVTTLPMSASDTTRRRYARDLRNRGLLFTRRIYHDEESAQEAGNPDLIGKMKALEYHLQTLFHNIVRVRKHIKLKKPLDEFKLEIPFEVARHVATGWFQDVPNTIKQACEQHIMHANLGQPLLLCQNGTVETTTMPKPTSRKPTSRKPTSRKWHRHKEDSVLQEETESQEEEGAATADTIGSAADAGPNPDIYDLLLNFNVGEPALSDLSTNGHDPQSVQAWIWYVQTQRDLKNPQGYLVQQLKKHTPPPPLYMNLVQLTPQQLEVLKKYYEERRWSGEWYRSALTKAGIDHTLAEAWYELEHKIRAKKEHY